MSLRLTVVAVLAGMVFLSVPVSAQYGPYSSRGLLEKKLYYADENGATGMCSFWSLYLGKHTCALVKPYPGEGDVTINAEVNFNFLSSLYIEGKGYSSRGKIDAEAKFAVAEGESARAVDPEQVEYVGEYGGIIKVSGSEAGPMSLSSQNNRLAVTHMLLRVFTMDKETKELKSSKDVAIKAFAFTKEDLAKALKAK